MKDEDLKEHINSLIRDEIQDVINDFVEEEEESKKSGLGFIKTDEQKELKVNVSQKEIDKIIKDYKLIKKSQRSNLTQIKKLALVDKHGNPLK